MTSISQKAIVARGLEPPRESKAEKVCPECNQLIPHPRNAARHRLFFAILKPAFQHWPESAPWQPTDTEDLRAKLLTEVGWCEVEELKFAGTSKKQMLTALAAFMSKKRKKQPRRFEATEDGMKAYCPKSIAWTVRCSDEDFKKILDDAIAFIEATIGTTVEQLRREHENEA